MVIFTILFASWCLKRKPEMHVLAPLARYVPVFLALYLAVKIGDMACARHVQLPAAMARCRACSWIVEMRWAWCVPLVMLLSAEGAQLGQVAGGGLPDGHPGRGAQPPERVHHRLSPAVTREDATSRRSRSSPCRWGWWRR